MAIHRFREACETLYPSAAAETVIPVGFMACPLVMSSEQQQFVQEVYRLARERVQEQTWRTQSRPNFSVN